MEITKRVSLPIITTQATFQPETLNEENRTVKVIFSTGAPVVVGGVFTEPFIQELSMKKEHVRLDRFNNGAPLLNNHQARDLNDVIGVIESASVNGKIGTALVRFSERADVQPIFDDVKNGILRNLSVGFRVHKSEERKERDGMKVLRSIDTEFIELSAVPAGADDGAKFRANNNEHKNTCEILQMRNEDPSDEIDGTDPEVTPSTESKVDKGVASKPTLRNDTKPMGDTQMDEKKKAELQRDAAKAEKDRQKGIRFAVRAAKLDTEFAETLIDEDITLDEAQTRVIAELAKKDDDKPTTTPALNVQTNRDAVDTQREGFVEALLHKYRADRETVGYDGKKVVMDGWKITEKGRPYMYRSLLDMARMSLEIRNINTTGMSKMQIAERSLNSSSDFPLALEQIITKTVLMGFRRAPATWEPFTRQVTAPDFKQISRVALGDGSKLLKIEEGGEFTHSTFSEKAEKYEIADYGKIFAITRAAIVNDDLQIFQSTSEKMGRRAKDLESDLVWDLISANDAMADGFAVYSTEHGNLSGTPAIPTEDGLSEGRKSMREQVGLDGEVIALSPKWLYVAPENETVAEKLVASIIPDSSANVSPFSDAGRTPLRLAIEPRIQPSTGETPWYLMSTLTQTDMVELARLEGQESPSVESKVGFEIDGLSIKIRHTLGAKVVEHRGLYKNAGV